MKNCSLGLCISALLFAATLAAQPRVGEQNLGYADVKGALAVYDVKYYGLKEGLTERTVTAICHDHEGMVWIGTETALFRFDGFEMLPIELPMPLDSSGKKTSFVTYDICEDPARRLWVATQHGLFMFPPDRNRPRFVVPDRVANILPERDYLLLGDHTRLRRLRWPPGEHAQPIVEPVALAQNLPWISIFEGNEGTYFLAGDSAAVWQIRNDTILRRCTGIPPGLPLTRAHLPGRSTIIAKCLHQAIAFRFDEQRGVFEGRPYSMPNLPDNPFYFSQLARAYAEANPLQVPPEVARWLVSGSACWRTDANGRLWLGTAYGIFVFTRRATRFEHLPFMRGMSCRAIFQEGENIWVSGAGLFQGQRTSESAQVFPLEVSRKLLPLDAERLLSIGEFDGFEIFNRKTNAVQKRLETQVGGHCHNLLRLRNGKIWQHRRHTLFQFFPEKNRAQAIAEINSGGTTLAMAEDRQGRVWMPSDSELLKIERDAAGKFCGFRKVLEMPFTDALLCGDSLWLGTRGSGLVCFDTKNERHIVTLTTANGLPNDFINCLLPDGNGNIWLSTNAGLSCFAPETQRFVNFSQQDGLEMDEYNMSSAWRDPQTGRLFFGGLNGVTHFDPAAIRKSPAAPQALFSKIVRLSEQAGALTTFLPDNDALPLLELAPGDRYLEFHLASSDPAAAEQTKFVHRLDGFDRDWMSAGKSNIVRFAMLPPGDYVFRIKSISANGVFSPERAINIHVAEVFYKTWWFALAALVLAVGLAGLEWRRRLMHLRNIYQIRKRIADDLHDDVASSLNYLSMVTKSLHEKAKSFAESKVPKSEGQEIVGRLAQIESLSDELIGKITDIVWAIDQRSQRLGDLVERMQDYGEDLLLQNNAPVEFSIRLQSPEKVLSLAVRQHVLLIFKESVNNIVRHTRSHEVKIRIENQADQLLLRIENRFEETRSPQFSTGKGLKSIEKRAENLLGNLRIARGKGVFCVELFLPTIFD